MVIVASIICYIRPYACYPLEYLCKRKTDSRMRVEAVRLYRGALHSSLLGVLFRCGLAHFEQSTHRQQLLQGRNMLELRRDENRFTALVLRSAFSTHW